MKKQQLSVIIPCETQFVACDLYAWSSCSVEVILKKSPLLIIDIFLHRLALATSSSSSSLPCTSCWVEHSSSKYAVPNKQWLPVWWTGSGWYRQHRIGRKVRAVRINVLGNEIIHCRMKQSARMLLTYPVGSWTSELYSAWNRPKSFRRGLAWHKTCSLLGRNCKGFLD